MALLALAAQASADYSPTAAKWNGWTVQTGEDLYGGARHTGYPIWQMFDRKPQTAWVFSGKFANPYPEEGGPPLRSFEARYWLELTPDNPVRLDELRIMNGYNKDGRTFGRNNRILELEVVAFGPKYGDRSASAHSSCRTGWVGT